ncbi:hypothetical protein [Streptomyces sp. URMC 129]
MAESVPAAPVPFRSLAVGTGAFPLRALLGTDRPVEHHGSPPETCRPPEG